MFPEDLEETAEMLAQKQLNLYKEKQLMRKHFLIVKIASLFIIFFSFMRFAGADTIYLKNGKKYNCRIIDKTDKYIKIDFLGVVLTYQIDELERIESAKEEISDSKQAMIKNPVFQKNSIEANFKKGTDYLKEGKWQEAVKEFERVISVDTYHVGAHFNLGCAFALMEEYEKAKEEFEKVLPLEMFPFNAFCYFNMGGLYAKKGILNKSSGYLKEAAEYFKKAAQVFPGFNLARDYAAHSQLIMAVFDTGGDIEHIAFSVAETGTPPDSAIFLSKADSMGDKENLVYLFGADSPPMVYFHRSPSCYYLTCSSKIDVQNLANIAQEEFTCLENIIDLVEKEDRFNKMIKWNSFIILSASYRDKNDFNKAVEFGEKAIALGLRLSSEYIHLANLYFYKKDYIKAKQLAEEALKINPDNTQLRKTAEEIIQAVS
ncbi:MAG: tetratricopeptide repeat protein [Candidatus Omnitrophota bacterium]|nr:tetratricopeptide repeat protein [Candidatus Omnitrophota bacterium]